MQDLKIPDFYRAYRHSTPSASTTQRRNPKHITFASLPTIVQRPHTSKKQSFALQQPMHGSIARRRTLSDASSEGINEESVPVLVDFDDIRWATELHPGRLASISRDENEAVSPNHRLPRVLEIMITEQASHSPLPTRRVGTSVAPLKSPYPRSPVGLRRQVRRALHGISRKFKNR